MKISTKEETRPTTKTSLFFSFLVKICFVMINKSGNDNIKFSYIKMIWYLIGTFGWFLSGLILTQVLLINSSLMDYYFKVFKQFA